MRVLLFWDVDGTLIKNDTSGQNLYWDALSPLLEDPLRPMPEIVRHGKTDAQIISEYTDAVGLPSALADEVAERLESLSRSAYSTPGSREALPGVTEALRLANRVGHVNSFLTGNSAVRTRLKISAAGLDLDSFDWELGSFGDRTGSRTALAVAAHNVAEAARMKPLVIGDTPSDAKAARHAAMPFCGVATGAYDENELARWGAELTIPDLVSGLHGLEQLLGRLSGDPDERRPAPS